jgi:predicted small lipoprotein YifL
LVGCAGRGWCLAEARIGLKIRKLMLSRMYIVATVSIAGLALAGCGVRGPLESPASAKAENAATARADSGQGKPEGAAAKPHKPFVLDGLIR